MYLEKLKIFGFKSFARKTNFLLTDGITGIVGPNGCGKSNIVDAIRWVLGEQKAGTLRSERMESVIFNGTRDMKPMGMAEVSITVKNTKNILPVEYSEVVITRRLFRSGESQYLMNNSVCRLKDITDLLMDTGMAADAYSVIELKMVESILSGKTEERRRIFEEAAGVTKYKQRRRITFRKLESTENDLIRVKDIIGEVEYKVNSLRRQVKRAQRYQKLTEQLSNMEIRIATHNYSKIYEELGPLIEQLELKKRDRETESTETSFKEAETEALKTELIQLEQNLRASQIELNATNDLIRKREEDILVKRERIKSLADDDVRITAEIEQLQSRVADQKQILEKVNNSIEEINKKIEIEESSFDKEEKVLEDVDRELKYKKEEGKKSENELLRLLDQISQKQRSIEHLKAACEHINKRMNELEEEKTLEIDQVVMWRNELSELEHKNKEKNDHNTHLSTKLVELNKRLENIITENNSIKEEIVKGYSQLDTLQHRIAIMNKLLESYSDFPEGVRHLMIDRQGYYGTVADTISVEEKYRQAVETILGESATYLLVKDSEQAFVGINTLKEGRKGVVTFLALDRIEQSNSKSPNVDFLKSEKILGWANEIVTCDPSYQPLINVLLGDHLIVTDLSVVNEFPQIMANNSFHVVTLTGELIASWGAIKGGRKSHDDTGVIGRRDQLKKFQNEVGKIQHKLKQLEENKQLLEQEHQSVTTKRGELQEEIASLQKELSDLTVHLSQVNYKISHSEERNQKIENEIIKLGDELKVAQQKIIDIELELKDEQQERLIKEEKTAEVNEKIESISLRRDDLSQKMQQVRLNLVKLNSEAKNLEGDLSRSKQIISESETSIQNKSQEKIQKQKQKEDFTVQIEELTSALSTDYSKKEKIEEVVSEKEQNQLSLRENIDQREKTLRKLRTEKESSSEFIHTIELRIAELKLNADNLFRQIGEDYNWDLKQEPIDPDYDLDTERSEIERTKQRIKALGLVNLLALKEYESEKERLDFLTKQHDDLIQAKENLNETVSHINKTAQEKFNNIFHEIQENFSNVFNQFFSEGHADLILAEDDDPLEANIEIIANPKGKRATSLTLLSGGEKALTAISLLFAIYLVKPSPFCILDEVDAPLDDTNIKRFTDALKKFSSDTQFLIVTHNKLTMRAADCLYGVTLEDNGVSKVVSVKME